MAIEAQNADYNLTTAVSVYNKTAAFDGEYELEFRIGDGTKNLNAGVGTLTFAITNNGNVDRFVYYKDVDTRVGKRSRKFFVASGTAISATLLSSNANDTDVDVTVTPRSVTTPQVVAQIIHRTSGSVYFVARDGDALHAGTDPTLPKLSPEATVEAASAGDVIVIGPGEYTLSGTGRIIMPDDVGMVGAGKDATKLLSAATLEVYGPIVNPGTRSRIEDLTIHGTLTGAAVYQACIGTSSGIGVNKSFTGAVVSRCRLLASSDGVYISPIEANPVLLTLENCDIETSYDCITVFKGTVSVHAKNCNLSTDGEQIGYGRAVVIQSYVASAHVVLEDTSIQAAGDTIAYGISTSADPGKFNEIKMYGGGIRTSDASASPIDAYRSGDGATATLIGVAHNSAKLTSGVVVIDPKVVPADASIKATTFDGSTAYPVTNADTGDTAILRKGSGTVTGTTITTAVGAAVASIVGGDGDTLETISGQIDGVSTASAAAIWANATRTLTSSASSVGPTAATSVADIYATVFADGTLPLSARVRHWDGDDLLAADLTSATYTAYALDADDPTIRTAITGHTAVALTPANIIFDLQSDEWASNWNFRHIPPISVSPLFETQGQAYMLEYTLTPTSGQVIVVRFRVQCK